MKSRYTAAARRTADETCFKQTLSALRGFESEITSPWDETHRLGHINHILCPFDEADLRLASFGVAPSPL